MLFDDRWALQLERRLKALEDAFANYRTATGSQAEVLAKLTALTALIQDRQSQRPWVREAVILATGFGGALGLVQLLK